ncbi:YciI family protein [Actinopolymorpha sp. B11F2]|uniref:YciI family protein n=1 Tax=Actinopolymorpha sp. B11F2 TaxID=3160862 RepID=UPI0032E3BF20
MARYLISFEDGAMDFPDEDLPDVAKAAHSVREEARDAGVFVFAGGLDYDVKPVVVATDGMVTDGPYPESKELLGGITIVDVPSRDAALDWAAKVAAGCRCAQNVRAFLPKQGRDEKARYLISFDNGAMDHFTEEDWPDVGETSHAVIEEAKDAGVYVCAGGLDYSPEDGSTPAWVGTAATDGTVTDGPRPKTRKPLGGFTVVNVPTREAALEWAAKIAVASRCAQDVRMFMPDPAVD